jgi:hypothetical protein
MMDGFDFNIQNYSLAEMEDLMGLAPKKNYTPADVALCKQRLIVKLASSGTQDEKMTDFLNAVHKCLLSSIGSSGSSVSSGSSGSSSSSSSSSSSGSRNSQENLYYSPVTNFRQNTIIPGSAADGHYVIPDPYRMYDPGKYNDTGGLVVGQSGAPPGTINPVKYSTVAISVNIDSRFRPNYFSTKSTDLNVTLPEKIHNIINYRVGSFEIPFYAIYSISELNGNNAIQIQWSTSAQWLASPGVYSNTFTIVIPDGNYYTTANTTNVVASASIETTINTIIASNTVAPALSGLLTFYIDQVSGRGVFAQPSGATTAIYFKVVSNVRSSGNPNFDAPLISFLGWQLGFRNAENISKNSGSGGFGSVVSEALVGIRATNYIFIAIDDYNNSVNDYYSAVFSESYAIKNIITRVNIGFLQDVNEASSIQLNRQRCFFGPVNIQKLRITLYDNFGRIVDLNNMDWNIELIFECVYD